MYGRISERLVYIGERTFSAFTVEVALVLVRTEDLLKQVHASQRRKINFGIFLLEAAILVVLCTHPASQSCLRTDEGSRPRCALYKIFRPRVDETMLPLDHLGRRVEEVELKDSKGGGVGVCDS